MTHSIPKRDDAYRPRQTAVFHAVRKGEMTALASLSPTEICDRYWML